MGIKNKRLFFFLKKLENIFCYLKSLSFLKNEISDYDFRRNVEVVEDADWTEFEFMTNKKGAYGPSKDECMQYYIEK